MNEKPVASLEDWEKRMNPIKKSDKRYCLTISINSWWGENFDDLEEAIARLEELKAKGPHSVYHTYYDIFDREQGINVYHFDFGNTWAFLNYMIRRSEEEAENKQTEEHENDS